MAELWLSVTSDRVEMMSQGQGRVFDRGEEGANFRKLWSQPRTDGLIAAPPETFPNSVALVRTRWPEADEGLIQRIAAENNVHDDTAIEFAIRRAHQRTGDRQQHQGMFLKTLPGIFDEMRREGLLPTLDAPKETGT
jgi:hypothetical protein